MPTQSRGQGTHKTYCGNGGGAAAKRSFSSVTLSAAIHADMPGFHTNAARGSEPSFTLAASVTTSNGPVCCPLMPR